MRLRAVSLFALVLISCTIPVNVGSFDVGVVGGTGGAGGGPGVIDRCGASSGRLRPYRVTLSETEVADPGCWIGRVVPPNHSLPEETFEVLIASLSAPYARSTLGVAGLSPQPLGDLGVVTVGEGVAGEDGFAWTQQDSVRGPAVDDPVETRTTQATFEFDRFDTVQTAGTLTLSAQYSCAAGAAPRNAPCPPSPPEDGGCTAVRTFIAVPISLPERWSTPTTPLLDGASQFLVSLDLGSMSSDRTHCGIIGQPVQTTRLTPRLRALEVWQATSSMVRVVPRKYQLGDAPLIKVFSDFPAPPDNTQSTSETTYPASDIKEVRITNATLPGTCGRPTFTGILEGQALQLESSYDCTGAGCALDQNGNPVRAYCELELPWFSIQFGGLVSQQP